MLGRIIERDRRSAENVILRHYREQYLPHAALVPSGRFGLYAAARELLSPGDHVIISPITCRTVLDALFAARVIPVLVDVEPATGNLDVNRLPNAVLDNARAIVTTNLYGNPDCALTLKRKAEDRGLLLIEDCAHVLDTSIEGRQIGGIGDVSVFSFKKYFDEPGGVITTRSENAARRIEERIAAEATPPTADEERLRYVQFRLAIATSASLVAGLSAAYRRVRNTGAGHNDQGPEGRNGSASPGRPPQQAFPTTASLLRVADILSRRHSFLADRMARTRSLIANCPLPVRQSSHAERVCYLAVPFVSPRRDAMIESLRQRGIPTYFLYSPPVNVLFRDRVQFAYPLNTAIIEEWCRSILPIDPRFSGCVEVLRSTS